MTLPSSGNALGGEAEGLQNLDSSMIEEGVSVCSQNIGSQNNKNETKTIKER